MPIIKPSLKFEGAETGTTQNTTPYLREDVRKVVFNKNNNQNGVYLYFLPPYRADSLGNGVWYKSIEIRDNFGDKYKEKYLVLSRENDPAEYFGRNFKLLYPEDAKPGTIVNNGKTFKKYPNYGRVTKRVLFNVAYANKLEAGPHILDLPLANGASQLFDWLSKTDIAGNPRPLVNNPEAAFPVFLQLKDSGTNPWQLNVEASQPAILPESIATSDNLYNLDEILVIRSKEEIIGKLREMYPSHVFEDCMNGYPGLKTTKSAGFGPGPVQPQFSATTVSQSNTPTFSAGSPVAKPVPAGNINLPVPGAAPVAVQADVPIKTTLPSVTTTAPIDPSDLPPNPMAAMSSMTREQAEKFLAS
jgi:hypothetical protein